MILPKEYEFLKSARRHKTAYEKFCALTERLPISPGKDLEKKYKEAIDFCHLNITPKAAFSFSVWITIFFFAASSLVALALHALTLPVLLLIVIFDVLIFYYSYNYPFHLATVFRINASSEMVLAIVYMTIAMRVSPNIENAVKFASENLKGPLAYDLKQLLWDIYNRKYTSMQEALETFINKWKIENEEFTQAIYLIETAVHESATKREQSLDEAVAIAVNGTKSRMRQYSRDLRTPVTVLNAMGIMLPIIGLIFFPIVSIFMPEMVRASFLVIGYDVILPVCVFWMMSNALEKRPYTFHHPDISKHPEFRKCSPMKAIILGVAVPIPFIVFGLYGIRASADVVSLNVLSSSLLITSGIAAGIVLYCVLSVWKKMKLREEIAQIEDEFAEALFQLGNQLTRGMPIENVLKKFTPSIRDMKISKFFERILYNIETFGMTFEQAVFDKERGAINFYPSTVVSATMKAIVEVSKRGMGVVSDVMVAISNYLKDVRETEEHMKDVLSEVTSSMEVQAFLLAPLTAGVVIALAAIIMQMMIKFKEIVVRIQEQMATAGPMGLAGQGLFTSFINVNKMIPIYNFQLIVGIYMIEVVTMLAMFLSRINHGEESLLKRLTIGKMLLVATVVYSIVVLLIFSAFTSLIPFVGLLE